MKEIRVYVVNLDNYFGDASLLTIHHEEFMSIAEDFGTVYSLKGFEIDVNNDWLSLDNCFIRFIEVECDESIDFEEFKVPKVRI